MAFGDALRSAAGELRAVATASGTHHRRLRDRLTVLLAATVVVDLFCAVLALAFERGQPQTEITNLGDALFWTSTQLLTVSSQLRNPLSAPGRVLDVLMELYAISVVSTLAGSLGVFFLKRGEDLSDLEDERPG